MASKKVKAIKMSFNDETLAAIKHLSEIGLANRKIADHLGLKQSVVAETIKVHNFGIKQRVFDASSEEEIRSIKLMQAAGVSIKTISEQIYHVSNYKIEALYDKLGLSKECSASIHSLDKSIFDNIDTYAKAYWLGYIFADGANQLKSLNFSVSVDRLEHLKKLATFLGDTPSRIKSNDKYAAYKVYSKELYDKLTAFGLVSPKTDAKFPTLTQGLFSHFLRGYVDGKGSLYHNAKTNERRLTISGNISILNTIIAQVPLDLHTSKNSSGYDCIVISGNKRVKVFYAWLYKDADVYCSDNYAQYELLTKGEANGV